MILGWRYGIGNGRAHQGHYVLVDSLFPWPSLHHGRENLRTWREAQKALRARGIAGPIDAGMGLTTAVKEDGDAILRVWPVAKGMMPRRWDDKTDLMWRDALRELRRWVGHNLACGVRLEWMPGDLSIERVQTVPSLKGQRGFWGWQRGEREPTAKMTRSIARAMGAQVAGFQPRRITGFNPGTGASPWP